MIHTENRQRLFDTTNGELIVVTAYDSMQLSGDMAAPFLQESTFWWLTGITTPGWKVVLDTSRQSVVLVRPERTDVDIIFNGDDDTADIIGVSGIPSIISAREFERYLRDAHRHHTIVHTLSPKEHHEFVLNPAKSNLVGVLQRIFDSVQYIDKTFDTLKALKQPQEIVAMKRAAALTCEVFKDVHERLAKFKSEAELAAEFTYRFHRVGATHAYEPIVASGKNACTLHYVDNTAPLKAREMVLIDIGARVDGYSADVTRTYCRNPTKRQRQVHGAVIAAHEQIISLIAPGILVSEYIKNVDNIMKRALQSIGLLDDIQDTDTYRKYFPHAISHGLGIDTHDSLGRPRYFEAGMVLTVEPGIYIPEEQIGVRIEDDILVTESGCSNLTGGLSTALTD